MKNIQHTLLRVWLIIWVVVLPLIHIHPEVDHAQAKSGHVHGGTYHSILVNTPVHAHEEHHHDGFFSINDESDHVETPLEASHGFEETTYGFSLIKPSIAAESENSGLSYDSVVITHAEHVSAPSNLTTSYIFTTIHFSVFPNCVSPRAPPILPV